MYTIRRIAERFSLELIEASMSVEWQKEANAFFSTYSQRGFRVNFTLNDFDLHPHAAQQFYEYFYRTFCTKSFLSHRNVTLLHTVKAV